MADDKRFLKILLAFLFLLAIFQLNSFSAEGALCDKVGKFGWMCRFTCNCRNREDCDKDTGHCDSGCQEGRYGTGCQFWNTVIYGNEKGIIYSGKYGKISSSEDCIAWADAQISLDDYIFPDGEVPGPYCRNPARNGVYSSGPWCYTENNFALCKGLIVKDCPDYLYGSTCSNECHCADVTEVCHKGTGSCKQCFAGWLGLNCSIPCPSGQYGEDCMQQCGQCQDDLCHHETGRCLAGCKPGYFGIDCKQKCHTGRFGVNCAGECGECKRGPCSHVTGLCYGGCLPGYQGERCLKRCRVGRYGDLCLGRCPFCYNNEPCHPETGVCEGGCEPGYVGVSCDQSCEDGFYGLNCSHACGLCHSKEPCDTFTGYCLTGCAPGYEGGHCLTAASVQVDESSSTGGIVAGVIIGILLIILVVAFLIYRKRRFHIKLIVSHEMNHTMIPTTETTVESIRETDLLLHEQEPTAQDISEVDGGDGMYDKVAQEPIYVNVNTKQLTNPIPVADLKAFLTKARENESAIIRAEHADLPTGLLALCHTARKPENKPKNRYSDIIAYDHSRVVLPLLSHDPHSDYVNANFIDGYNKPKAYIASQGPNKAMLNDFWRMVWQEKVTKIVMLTNLVETCKKKCEQYWPQEGSYTYGEVTVEMLDTAEYTDYTIRTFKISLNKISRIIKQFHFLSWTDHGAPTHATTLLHYMRKVQQYNTDSQAAIMVHCSAGIGRSGTYIAVDYLLQQAKAEGKIDLLQCAQLMRCNRVNMIQTWQQYSFIYSAVLEALLSGDTTITNSAFSEAYEDLCTLKPDTSSTPLEDQFETLQSLATPMDRDECKAALESVNVPKSRFRNILPANRFRPYLFTPVDDGNDFINAVFLPSYTQRDAFIVTQMPLPNTVADFWRLLYDYHSDTVVMLNEFDRNDRTCALYWPEEYGYTVEHGPLSIELLFSSEADTNITVRTFKLTHRLKGEDRAVKQFQFNAWPDYKSVPAGTSALLRLTDMVQEWTRQNGKGPITVHCMNGASKCGLFSACSLVFERMRVDHEVDVYQTVKQIRINRPHFVENMEQYQFIYQMALAYLERQPIGIERQVDRQTNDSIDSGIQDRIV